MAGITDLDALLRDLSPRRREGEFVYVSAGSEVPAEARIVEREGVTLVLRRETAEDHGLTYEATFGWITLEVHSSLEAVGLTAAVSTALARAGISCNLLAGFHHDHLLIPAPRVDEALAVLKDLSKPAARGFGITIARWLGLTAPRR